MMNEGLTTISCPYNTENCLGLATSSLGGGIEIEETETGYIARLRDGGEFFGNCDHYQECMTQQIKNSSRLRIPAIINPCSEVPLGIPQSLDMEIFCGINAIAAQSKGCRNLFDRGKLK